MSIQTLITSRRRITGDLTRAADVAAVLVKYGLAGFLTSVPWQTLHDALKSHGGEILSDQPLEVRVRLALTDLGTTFIKLGQMLSTRPDLIGHPLALELTKLQTQTPPDAPEVATQVVENELGRPVGECFRTFESTAMASASI